MAPPAEPFTYDDLTEVYRREQRSKSISDVRKDLYHAIRQCLDVLRQESEREVRLDPFSTRAKLAANQLSKFQEKAGQVFEFRMEKIMAMSLRSALGNRVDTARMTGEETEVFERVSSLLRERHSSMLEGRSPPEAPAEEPAPLVVPVPLEVPLAVAARPATMAAPVLEVPPAAEAPLPVPTPVPSPPAVAPATAVPAATPLEFVVLRVLEDIPAFAGPERNYRLKKEDLVSLPPLIAKALVARKKAVMVDMAPPARL